MMQLPYKVALNHQQTEAEAKNIMAANTLYILYNADASIMGKLKYGYRKICKSTEENPACAACKSFWRTVDEMMLSPPRRYYTWWTVVAGDTLLGGYQDED